MPTFQNALKTEGEAASSFIQVRCRTRDKAQWVKAADARAKAELARNGTKPDGRGCLAGWVVDTLNHAAKKQLGQTLRGKPDR